MSEDRKIGDLPASDSELSESGGGAGARPAAPPERGQPTPEATQPSPEATQPSPDGGAQRMAPPEQHEPRDPEE